MVVIIESATAKDWTGSPDLPDLACPTRSAASPNGIELHYDSASASIPRTTEQYRRHSDGQNDAVQPRPRLPPVVVYPPPPPPPPPPISIAEMSVPPPPPMPTLNGPHSNLMPTEVPSAILDKLDGEQQSLRDLRDDLLGSRFSIAAKRQELRDLHIETSAKDGFVFKLLRQYLNEIGADLPREIEDALGDASSLRDRLGLLEAGYDDAEASYNTLEWKYSRRETRFVEEVLNNKFVPSETLDRSRSADNLEILQLTRFMTGAADMFPTISDPTTSGYDAGAVHGTQLSGLLAEQAIESPHRASVRFRPPSFYRGNMNDVHQTHSHLRWVEKMNTIDEWLFKIVETSRIQKVCLKATYDFGFTDTEIWWEHTKWLLIQDYSPYFHTGDSTVSDRATGKHISGSGNERGSSVSSALESRSSSQILLGIQPLDVSDTAALPSVIDSNDCYETTSQARASTELPVDTREEVTSSASDPHSIRCRTSQRDHVTNNDRSAHHEHNYTRSLAVRDGDKIQKSPTSWNMTQTLSRRSGQVQRRHTIPEIKDIEPLEALSPAITPRIPSFSPRNIPPPVFYPNSRKLRRRHSSQTNNRLCKCSESPQSSASVPPNLESRKTTHTAMKDRCLVM